MLATANRTYDFYPIAFLQRHRGMFAPGDDLFIDFDRQALPRQVEGFQQLGNRSTRAEFMAFIDRR